MKQAVAQVTVTVEGSDRLVIRLTDDGWEITGDSLRGHGGPATILDPDGHRAIAELFRYVGAIEARAALVFALNRNETEGAAA